MSKNLNSFNDSSYKTSCPESSKQTYCLLRALFEAPKTGLGYQQLVDNSQAIAQKNFGRSNHYTTPTPLNRWLKDTLYSKEIRLHENSGLYILTKRGKRIYNIFLNQEIEPYLTYLEGKKAAENEQAQAATEDIPQAIMKP